MVNKILDAPKHGRPDRKAGSVGQVDIMESNDKFRAGGSIALQSFAIAIHRAAANVQNAAW
jgi:hypothetical protein